ncbi:MAG: diacylglycerol kinase family protein [Chitinophagales bacterium]
MRESNIMESKNSSSLNEQAFSFVFAFNGIRKFIFRERNARWHLLATIIVAGASIYFKVSSAEITLLIVLIGLVWIAEMFNTCIEKLIDYISDEHLPVLGYIKDLAAGAVLVASICAFIAGLIIFIPKII